MEYYIKEIKEIKKAHTHEEANELLRKGWIFMATSSKKKGQTACLVFADIVLARKESIQKVNKWYSNNEFDLG